MKKNLLFAALALGLGLLAASCNKKEFASTGGEVLATFTISTPGTMTKAETAGKGETVDKVKCVTYDAAGVEIPTLTQTVPIAAKKATYSTRLIKGQAYRVAFFAYNEAAAAYDLTDLKNITVKGNQPANEEGRDAFTAFVDITAQDTEAPISKNVDLYRPFAQLNIACSAADLAATAAAGVVVAQSKVKISGTGVAFSAFNAYEDKAVAGTVVDEVEYSLANIIAGETIIVEGVEYNSLSMNYFLVGDKGEKNTATVEFDWAGSSKTGSATWTNVPLQRNHRTNIIGYILTNPAEFNIFVENKFDKDDYNYFVPQDSDPAPANVITLSDDWHEVTAQWQNDYNINFGDMRMYKTSALLGTQGNEAYVLTVPAGKVGMKVCEKNGDAGFKISRTVRQNTDYTLFVPQNGPGVWSGTTAGYYSPLAYGPDAQGVTKVLRNDGFGGTTKMYSPVMALKDGCVSIKPAGSKNDGKLYYYSDTKGNGETLWTDPECAFGGIFFCVKDGANLVSAEGAYDAYDQNYRAIQGLKLNTNYLWNAQTVAFTDALKNGRLSIGCTAKGDLVLFSCVKLVNTHNQGQNTDINHDGKASDTKGITFYELGSIMAGFGCSDAMTLDDPAYTYFVLQDGSNRGKDLFPVNNRWKIPHEASSPITEMNPEDKEFTDLVITCFK